MKVLITGASGQVGCALLGSGPTDWERRALSRDELDITDVAAVRAAIRSFEPDVIINAAAYTAVDRAEAEPLRAQAVNASGASNLARAASSMRSCRMLQISTDYVFDGRAAAPYRPHDLVNPLSVYGRTKLEGEQGVLQLLPGRSAVLRTAWVYAPAGRNFVLTMLRLMRERGSVRVVSDQIGAPTAARSVATALWRLAASPQLSGIFHWSDMGTLSWYDLARAVAEEGRALGLLANDPTVTAISTADYPTAAVRPRYSVLDVRDSAQQLGLEPVHWRTSLRAVLTELATR